MRSFVIALIVWAILVLPSSAADWPMFHVKGTHTGFNPMETTIDRNNVKFLALSWVGLAGDLVDSSSPAVVGTSVYVGSTDGKLYVFDAAGCGAVSGGLTAWLGELE